MCGISAYIGDLDAMKSITISLEKLEYRGYDSAGMVLKDQGEFHIIKSLGTIEKLKNKTKKVNKEYHVGIGHTRWATHGKPSVKNAHPHISNDKNIAIVHNGIIENYLTLKEELEKEGYYFYSQTDTEVIANLLQKYYNKNFLETLNKVCSMLEGSYAFAIINRFSNSIYIAKNKSPLYVGFGENEIEVSSDMSTFFNKKEKCFSLEDGEIGEISRKKVQIYDKNMKKIDKNMILLDNFKDISIKNNEEYFMIKEIKEIPFALKNEVETLKDVFNLFDRDFVKGVESFEIIGCGTAFHAGMIGARYIEKICRIPCHTYVASEFKYSNPILSKNKIYVFISQSGETADTIACANMIKDNGCKAIAFTNVEHCTLNNIVDKVIPVCAGKEIAVASTKAYNCQTFALLFFANYLIGNHKCFYEKAKDYLKDFKIDFNKNGLSKVVSGYKNIFFVGRQGDYISCMEASLKLKEISYINCIAISSGELKHGSLALIDKDTLVIAICTDELIKDKLNSNVEEIKARGGKVLLYSTFNRDEFTKVDYFYKLGSYDEDFNLISSIIPFQLLAFNVSLEKGYNPDKPRNLAKSVTVE